MGRGAPRVIKGGRDAQNRSAASESRVSFPGIPLCRCRQSEQCARPRRLSNSRRHASRDSGIRPGCRCSRDQPQLVAGTGALTASAEIRENQSPTGVSCEKEDSQDLRWCSGCAAVLSNLHFPPPFPSRTSRNNDDATKRNSLKLKKSACLSHAGIPSICSFPLRATYTQNTSQLYLSARTKRRLFTVAAAPIG